MSFENPPIQAVRPNFSPDEISSRVLDLTLFLLVVAALGTALFLSPPIWEHGEAREGLVVEGILQNHDWVLPLRNGELPSKPPLFHWIAAVLTELFGFSDTVVRLPSLIGAMIMLIATFGLAEQINGRKTAWIAVAVLLGTYEFWDSATEARVDMIFSAAVTTSLAAWLSWYRTGEFWPKVACYLAVACAVLSKGPAGAVLPGATVLGFLWMEGKLRRIKDFWSWRLALIVIFIDLSWYAAAFFVGGEPFVMKQVISENIDRFAGTGKFHTHHHTLPPLVWLETRLLPWNFVILVALFRRLRGQREDSVGRFLHAWWSSVFIIFFLAAGQRAVYLLTLYPAVALLAARALGQWLDCGDSLSGTRRLRRYLSPGTVLAPRKRPLALASTVVLIIVCLAIATPVARWSQMERSTQTAFFERTITLLPKEATVEADPSFPETDLIILSYRLNRPIPRKVATCEGTDYYLAMRSALPSCLAPQHPLASSGQNGHSLVLMGPMDHRNGSSPDVARGTGLSSLAVNFSVPATSS